MDTISKGRRSANMAAIRSTGTTPELIVRRALFREGLRYRLHDKQLPGRPDIVFPSRRVVVFVHGCFWHGCTACIDGQRAVKSNRIYWARKIRSNQERDERNRKQLLDLGWRVEEIWECEAAKERNLVKLVKRVRALRPKDGAQIAEWDWPEPGARL